MSTVKFLDNLKLSNNEMKVISGLERAGFFECAEAIYIEHPCRLFRNDHNVKYVKGCNIQEVIGLAFWMTTETGMDDHRMSFKQKGNDLFSFPLFFFVIYY